jgi:hypothetical protein
VKSNFTGFRVFSLILHFRYMLTRKIILFHELTHNFNNIVSKYLPWISQVVVLDSLVLQSIAICLGFLGS